MFERVTLNLSPAGKRKAVLEGREYWVVPTVMMTHGVHAGSDGPGYYPQEELGRTPGIWNHKPLVVDHPTINGAGVSACSQAVLEAYKIGLILNTAYRGKLATESWVDIEKAQKVPKGQMVLDAIVNNQMMEVSTGLQCDKMPESGNFNGKAYNWVARNIAPDHLAILPDSIGACSIADGAGLLRNQAMEQYSPEFIASRLHGLTTNEMSHSNIFEQLNQQLRPKLSIPSPDGEGMRRIGWLEDVYDKFFVFSENEKLFRQGYTASKTEVAITGEPEEVKRVTEYRTVAGAFVGNSAGDKTPLTRNEDMDRAKKVGELIANSASGWTEEDRDFLTKVEDKQFTRIVKNAETAIEAAKPKQPVVTPPQETPTPATAPVTSNAKPLTDAEYIQNAPPGVRAVIQYGMQQQAAERARLTTVITANSRNPYTPEELAGMDLVGLQRIAQLAGSGQTEQPSNSNGGLPVYPGYSPNFFGAQGAAPVQNAAASKLGETDVMELPKMTW